MEDNIRNKSDASPARRQISAEQHIMAQLLRHIAQSLDNGTLEAEEGFYKSVETLDYGRYPNDLESVCLDGSFNQCSPYHDEYYNKEIECARVGHDWFKDKGMDKAFCLHCEIDDNGEIYHYGKDTDFKPEPPACHIQYCAFASKDFR